jgi:epoxyqueuosine reductase
LVSGVEPLLRDGAAIVRGAAVWALRRLIDNTEFSLVRDRHLAAETDVNVRNEWKSAEPT